MIMEWKKQTEGFHAVWRGTQLTLFENQTTKQWHMRADAKLVKQHWPSARKAMDEVERRQQKLVMDAVAARRETISGHAASA